MKNKKILSTIATLVTILIVTLLIFILELNIMKIYAVEQDGNTENKVLNKSEVYILPLLNSSVIGNLDKGDTIKIISINGQWSFVQNNEIRGWVFSKYIETPTTNDNDTSEDTITKNEVTNTSDSTNSTNSEASTNIKYPTTMYVNVDAVNIRESASTTSKIVTSVGINCPVRVTAKEGDWYKVEVSDGKGYIKTEFLSLNKN